MAGTESCHLSGLIFFDQVFSWVVEGFKFVSEKRARKRRFITLTDVFWDWACVRLIDTAGFKKSSTVKPLVYVASNLKT